MKKLGIGIVGAGFVSNLHVDAYERVTGITCKVVGVYAADDPTAWAGKHGVRKVYASFEEMLDDPEVDVVDVCVPNAFHAQYVIMAANAGKHVICEKPLTGAFGEDESVAGPAGLQSKEKMYREAMANANAMVEAAERNHVRIGYAEDFVYSPIVTKAKRLIDQSNSAIIEIRTEESHSGSHAGYARHWRLAGGGSMLRMGSHPIGLAMYLKRYEGMVKYGKPTEVKSVYAETANLTHTEHFRKYRQEWIVNEWADVEDWAHVILTFEDDTKAVISSNDTTLGGIVNTFDIFTTNSVMHCDMAANTAMKVYTPSPLTFGDEYISEKIETKAGWTFPSPDEDWMRGYPQEMQDFAESFIEDREPISNGELGRQVVKVIYAGYLSAESGRKILLSELED